MSNDTRPKKGNHPIKTRNFWRHVNKKRAQILKQREAHRQAFKELKKRQKMAMREAVAA